MSDCPLCEDGCDLCRDTTEMVEARKAEVKQRILDIRCGWEWAFANGARCAGADNHPDLQAVIAEERELKAELLLLQGG